MLPIRRGKVADHQDKYTREDLIQAANDSIDHVLGLIEDLPDSFVTFQPVDPKAYDRYAATPEEENIAWTLGHIVVHMTASVEEAAALSAQMARGIPIEGRSRYEVPWQTVTTIAQLVQRLEESRRIQVAYLNAWPDEPHLDVTYDKFERWAGKLNAVGRFLSGLNHSYGHYEQLEDVIGQAQAAETA